MLRTILANRYALNLQYARDLVADVDDAASVTTPAPGMNHPRWVVGHLVLTADAMTGHRILGLELTTDAAWDGWFGGGTPPRVGADADAYPPLTQLLAALETRHEAIADAVRGADASIFERTTPEAAGEGFRKRFPTVGGALLHTMVAHEMQHLGQLSAWRRAKGLPSV